MTVADILAAFGDLADDLGQPPLWSDAVRLRFLREAQLEACRRARLFQDQSTDEICKIDIIAGQATYDVDPRIIFVRRVKLASQDDPVQKADIRALDNVFPGWEGHPASWPSYWTPVGNHQITFYPTPEANDTCRLTVIREPLGAPALEDLTPRAISILTSAAGVATAVLAAPVSLSTRQSIVISGAAQPEYNGAHEITVVSPSIVTFTVPDTTVSPATGTITFAIAERGVEVEERHQDKLVDWMLYRELSMRDKEEKYDTKAAQDHLDVFESEFGKRSSAIDETWIARQHGYDQDEGLF
jgi:hypothetical protein